MLKVSTNNSATHTAALHRNLKHHLEMKFLKLVSPMLKHVSTCPHFGFNIKKSTLLEIFLTKCNVFFSSYIEHGTAQCLSVNAFQIYVLVSSHKSHQSHSFYAFKITFSYIFSSSPACAPHLIMLRVVRFPLSSCCTCFLSRFFLLVSELALKRLTSSLPPVLSPFVLSATLSTRVIEREVQYAIQVYVHFSVARERESGNFLGKFSLPFSRLPPFSLSLSRSH